MEQSIFSFESWLVFVFSAKAGTFFFKVGVFLWGGEGRGCWGLMNSKEIVIGKDNSERNLCISLTFCRKAKNSSSARRRAAEQTRVLQSCLFVCLYFFHTWYNWTFLLHLFITGRILHDRGVAKHWIRESWMQRELFRGELYLENFVITTQSQGERGEV